MDGSEPAFQFPEDRRYGSLAAQSAMSVANGGLGMTIKKLSPEREIHRLCNVYVSDYSRHKGVRKMPRVETEIAEIHQL